MSKPALPRSAAAPLPPLACDCHVHVFGPFDRFPLDQARSYSPPEVAPDQLNTFLSRLGAERVVIVQPSVHGLDNRAALAAAASLGKRARVVAQIREDANDAELAMLHAGGVRGARVNFITAGAPEPSAAAVRLAALAERIASLGWHIQLFAPLTLIANLRQTLQRLPVPVVLDHFGCAEKDTSELHELFALLERGDVHIKLSAPQKLLAHGFDDAGVAALARQMMALNASALLWGSDWPHPVAFTSASACLEDVDDRAALEHLAEWAGDAGIMHSILVGNPARLYQFDAD